MGQGSWENQGTRPSVGNPRSGEGGKCQAHEHRHHRDQQTSQVACSWEPALLVSISAFAISRAVALFIFERTISPRSRDPQQAANPTGYLSWLEQKFQMTGQKPKSVNGRPSMASSRK